MKKAEAITNKKKAKIASNFSWPINFISKIKNELKMDKITPNSIEIPNKIFKAIAEPKTS